MNADRESEEFGRRLAWSGLPVDTTVLASSESRMHPTRTIETSGGLPRGAGWLIAMLLAGCAAVAATGEVSPREARLARLATFHALVGGMIAEVDSESGTAATATLGPAARSVGTAIVVAREARGFGGHAGGATLARRLNLPPPTC